MSTAFFSDKQRSWGVLLILAAVCLSTYWTSLHNDFMIDDHGIFNDPKIQNIQFLPYLFIPDKSTVLRIDSNSMDTYYRPLQNLLLMLSHLAFGNQPFYYHLLNLFLLVACCFTLYLFINFVFDNSPSKQPDCKLYNGKYFCFSGYLHAVKFVDLMAGSNTSATTFLLFLKSFIFCDVAALP